MSKIGRPPVDESDRLGKVVAVRMTEKTYEDMMDICRNYGIHPCEFCRISVAEKIEKMR